MHIDVSDSVPLPADEVFHLLRDDMPALVPYLYDVDRIVVVERREEGDEVFILNHWFGSMDKVPRALRAFIKPEIMSWNDHATWSTSQRKASWRLESRVGDSVFDCTGSTQLTEVDDGNTRIEMDIDLVIHPERVPGVPRLLAKRVRGQIEQLIAKQITPNLRNLAVSIRRYAAEK